jgi:hypothetical protein
VPEVWSTLFLLLPVPRWCDFASLTSSYYQVLQIHHTIIQWQPWLCHNLRCLVSQEVMVPAKTGCWTPAWLQWIQDLEGALFPWHHMAFMVRLICHWCVCSGSSSGVTGLRDIAVRCRKDAGGMTTSSQDETPSLSRDSWTPLQLLWKTHRDLEDPPAQPLQCVYTVLGSWTFAVAKWWPVSVKSSNSLVLGLFFPLNPSSYCHHSRTFSQMSPQAPPWILLASLLISLYHGILFHCLDMP